MKELQSGITSQEDLNDFPGIPGTNTSQAIMQYLKIEQLCRKELKAEDMHTLLRIALTQHALIHTLLTTKLGEGCMPVFGSQAKDTKVQEGK